MAAPAKSTETTSTRKTRATTSKPAATPRRRPVKKPTASRVAKPEASTEDTSVASPRTTGRQTEELAMVGLALVLGLIGFAVHFVWFAAIVMMSILFGLMASELRSRRSGGVMVEVVDAVVSEAKSLAEAITSGEAPQADDPAEATA
jgi:hypothetical protein